MQCVILAGGLGTRMRPYTEKFPKALLPAHGKPFLDYQLSYLACAGVTHVALCIGYLGEAIQEFAGDGSKWGLKIEYTNEGKDLMGTAGAIRLVFDEGLLQDRFFILYGDSFLPIDFADVWKTACRATEPFLMTVLKNHGKWDASNCSFDGRKVFYDKKANPKPPEMIYVDYGLSVCTREVIESQIPRGQKYDLADLMGQLSRAGQVVGYEVFERFYEIGSPQGLKDFEQYIGKNPIKSR